MDAQTIRRALKDFLSFNPKEFTVQPSLTGNMVSLRQRGAAADVSYQVITNSTILTRFFGNSISSKDQDGFATAAGAEAALPGVQSDVDALAVTKVTNAYQQSEWGNPWPGNFGDPDDAASVDPDVGILYGIGIPQVAWSSSYKISGLGVIDGGGSASLSYNAVAVEQAVRLRVTIWAQSGVPCALKVSYVKQVYLQQMRGGLTFGTSGGTPFCNVLSRTLVEETPGEMEVQIGLLGYNSFDMPLDDITTADWPEVTMPTDPPNYYLVNNNMLQLALMITNIEKV